MNPIDLIPWIGTIVNTAQSIFGESAPDATAWTASTISTVGSFGVARALLMLPVWDDVVKKTKTPWDNILLRVARQVLSVFAVKRGKK